MPACTSFTEKLGAPGCAQWHPFRRGPGGTLVVHYLPRRCARARCSGQSLCWRRLVARGNPPEASGHHRVCGQPA
eukprot:7216776-Alexandrium_andersonii.AAC.1